MKSFQWAQEITERLLKKSPANRDMEAILATAYRRTGELTEDPAQALD
jgi:hypothetical protein